MRKSKYTKWFEDNYPEHKDKKIKDIAKHFKISPAILNDAFNRGVGAYETNYGAVRPSVKKLPEEGGKQVWGKARMYKLVKNIMHYRKDEIDKIPKSRGSDYDLVLKQMNKK